MHAGEIWTGSGVGARVVVMALAAMWVLLAAAIRDLVSRARQLEAEAVRLGELAERPRTDIPRPDLAGLERQARRLAAGLDERVSSLPGLMCGAPLVGLFGTLMGILGGLSTAAAGGEQATASLGAVIAAALVPTVVGLVLAMAATWTWTCFWARAARLKLRLEEALEDLAAAARQPATLLRRHAGAGRPW